MDFIHGVTVMCCNNAYAESTMKMLASKTKWSNPCGKWIRDRIRTIPEEKMQIQCLMQLMPPLHR